MCRQKKSGFTEAKGKPTRATKWPYSGFTEAKENRRELRNGRTSTEKQRKDYMGSQGSRMKFKAECNPEENPKEKNRRTFQSSSRTVVCYKCGKAGHIVIRCQLGKGPERDRTQSRKPQGTVTTARGNQSYRPWTKKGIIRGPHVGPVKVSALRDTGASQSLLLRKKVP